MSRKKTCVTILIVTGAIAFGVYFSFFRYSCQSYSAGKILQGNKESGCVVSMRSCRGFACVAPALSINCGETRDVCGKSTQCHCN